MKTSIDHLPAGKRRALARYVQILREEFADKLVSVTSERKKSARILKIILFGSHVFGRKSRAHPMGWTEDRVSGYFSDYDLLVIVNDGEFTDMAEYWGPAEDRLLLEAQRGGSGDGLSPFAAIPQFIVHSLEEVNSALTEGRYFFTDIIEDGILLYALEETKGGNKKYQLAKPGKPEPVQAHKMAQGYFEQHLPDARYNAELAAKAINDGQHKHAAFLLHQTVERAYTCFLLTRTLYSPATHNLSALRSMAEDRAAALRDIWPARKPYRRYFGLLKKAYVEARYSPHYDITREELDWLAGRTAMLLDRVEEICTAHLDATAPK